MRYQVYFRISRGGTGIPYDLAKMEFLSVFGRFRPGIVREWWAKHRMWVDLDLGPQAVASAAAGLGYTDGILHLASEPYRGETIRPIERGRWYTGWVRERDRKVLQTEVYVQDRDALLAEAPHNRTFDIREGADVKPASGHRAHRALSTLDARFLLNIVDPRPTDLILDPFAGFGGFVREAVTRGLRIVASDLDETLFPGLAKLDPLACFRADASRLPLATGLFDTVITEPPFHPSRCPDVLAAVREMVRVLKPGGRMLLLIADHMRKVVGAKGERAGCTVRTVGVVPRGGGMRCPVLEMTTGRHHRSP